MANIGKSLHISWEELACNDGTPYPFKFILDGRVIELIVVFERIRFICGGPIIINSAYRTPVYNKKVGGASKSLHIEGKALDLQPPKLMTVNDFYHILKIRHKELGIRGLGKYPNFVHIDIRDSNTLVEWGI